MTDTHLIVHICNRKAWESAQLRGEYQASSLETEGFIHCSRSDQVLAVANRFYMRIPDLLLLWINPQLVSAEIKFEPVNHGTKTERFPHIYGSLNLDAVVASLDFVPAVDGVHKEVPGLN